MKKTAIILTSILNLSFTLINQAYAGEPLEVSIRVSTRATISRDSTSRPLSLEEQLAAIVSNVKRVAENHDTVSPPATPPLPVNYVLPEETSTVLVHGFLCSQQRNRIMNARSLLQALSLPAGSEITDEKIIDAIQYAFMLLNWEQTELVPFLEEHRHMSHALRDALKAFNDQQKRTNAQCMFTNQKYKDGMIEVINAYTTAYNAETQVLNDMIAAGRAVNPYESRLFLEESSTLTIEQTEKIKAWRLFKEEASKRADALSKERTKAIHTAYAVLIQQKYREQINLLKAWDALLASIPDLILKEAYRRLAEAELEIIAYGVIRYGPIDFEMRDGVRIRSNGWIDYFPRLRLALRAEERAAAVTSVSPVPTGREKTHERLSSHTGNGSSLETGFAAMSIEAGVGAGHINDWTTSSPTKASDGGLRRLAASIRGSLVGEKPAGYKPLTKDFKDERTQ